MIGIRGARGRMCALCSDPAVVLPLRQQRCPLKKRERGRQQDPQPHALWSADTVTEILEAGCTFCCIMPAVFPFW